MSGTLSSNEQSQLLQTIEMFEFITQSQPLDCQSLEILKEAYHKLEREEDVTRTSRRIAQAYVQLGQYSSAILEYESILQRHPEDADVLAALAEIESAATNLTVSSPAPAELDVGPKLTAAELPSPARHDHTLSEVDDGRQTMFKLFVESKVITQGDFDLCWPPYHDGPVSRVVEPFLQSLLDRGTLLLDKSLKIVLEKSRLGYINIDRYDIDYELARSYPADICRRWCVLPFDKMSKSILVATANPFNRQAAKELEAVSKGRLIWYLAPPPDLIKALKKSFR